MMMHTDRDKKSIVVQLYKLIDSIRVIPGFTKDKNIARFTNVMYAQRNFIYIILSSNPSSNYNVAFLF